MSDTRTSTTSVRCTSTARATLTTVAQTVNAQFGCPVPGYQPGVGYITQGPGVTTQYAEPYQADGETEWSIVYDAVTKPVLDAAGLIPKQDATAVGEVG